MRAIVIKEYGGAEVLALETRPDPEVRSGHVLIEVKAFGINHAEIYFRKGAWGDVAEITGIECAGLVKADPSGSLVPGQKVIAIVGGMGRSINGSYAELVNVPADNVAAVDADLSWEELAAIPESYTTTWTSLCGISGRDRRPDRRDPRRDLGARPGGGKRRFARRRARDRHHAQREARADAGGAWRQGSAAGIAGIVEARPRTSSARDRRGPRHRRQHDSGFSRHAAAGRAGLPGRLPRRRRAADAGAGVPDSERGSALRLRQRGRHRLGGIPDYVASGAYRAKPASIFQFEDIQAAHRLIESNEAGGKLVVRVA